MTNEAIKPLGDYLTKAIDEELAQLRAHATKQSARVNHAATTLRARKAKETEELRLLQLKKAARRQLRSQHATRLQAQARGWLTRRHLAKGAAVEEEGHAQQGANMVPVASSDHLREQLAGLQLQLHDMEYRTEDRVIAVRTLQAWWRSVLAGRILWVMHLADKMRDTHEQICVAVLRIQSWFRMKPVERRFRSSIQAEAAHRHQKQREEMERLVKVVVVLQRSFRRRLQQAGIRPGEKHRNVTDMSPTQAKPQNEIVLIDSWKPGGIAAGKAAVHNARAAAIVGDRVPKRDPEIGKIQEAGLVPFYGSSAREIIRHRVGGPSALKMQRQLGIGRAEDSSLTDDDLLHDLGTLWDVYPEGVSWDFLGHLDDDTWAHDHRGNQRSLRQPADYGTTVQKPKEPRRRRRKTRLIIPPPPSHAENRIRAHREQREANERNQQDVAGDANLDMHPLLVGAPVLPSMPMLSDRAPQLGRRDARLASGGVNHASWEGATSFF